MKTVERNDKGEITHVWVDNKLLPKQDAEKVLSEPPHYFPNGFESWHETHFEIVAAIQEAVNTEGTKAFDVSESQGTGGLYEFAKDLTTEFEKKFEGVVWGELDKDGNEQSYVDEIEKFTNEKIY
jgi:hypothetical protein